MIRTIAVAAGVLLGPIPSGPAAAPSGPSVHAPTVVHGMTVSCAGAGLSWGSDAMVATMGKLSSLGVNWIAIHPYGGLREDGTVGQSGIDRLLEDPWWLRRAIDEAHRLGLAIMIKPHLAYWGTRFSWRGDIRFETDAERARFFETYEDWIVRVARLSAGMDAFVVGTELDQTAGDESSWRRIIAAVREETAVPLTYSASWATFEDVGFWDALDVIAIQAYFPLVDHEEEPTSEELTTAWAGLVARLEAFGRQHDRKIVLGELGYNRSRAAAVRPWAYGQDADPLAETIQGRCLNAALDAIEGNEVIVGAFLWKWFPGESERSNFLESTPAMREVIARHWRDMPGTN